MSFIDTTVGDYCPFIYGKGLSQSNRVAGVVPVFGSNGCVDFHNESYVRGPGIIIGRKGSVGAVHISLVPFWPIDTSFYVEKDSLDELKFTYYLLKSLGLEHMNSDSAVPGLNRDNAHNLPIRIPEKKQDREVLGRWISIYDEKIEINRQINQTLEQMAQAIFKSWFVDFDPVRAKMEGRDTGLPKHITDLFPDELVESELGLVPKGWEVTNLKSVTTELRRGISPKYTEENGICVINQKCIRNHSVNFEHARLNDPKKKNVDDRLIQVGDVLVNSTGVGTLGRLAPVRYLLEPTTFDSHVTMVRANTDLVSKSFLTGLMLMNESFIESSGAGSTGQTELNKQVLEDINFAKPPAELCDFFHAIAEPIHNQIAVFEQEKASLAKIRDTLLPKLLSGEIEVGEVG